MLSRVYTRLQQIDSLSFCVAGTFIYTPEYRGVCAHAHIHTHTKVILLLIYLLLSNTDEAITSDSTAEMSKRLNYLTLSSSLSFQGFLNAVFERLKQFLECCEYLSLSWISDPRLLPSVNKLSHRCFI